MKETDSGYQVETAELNEENMHFTVEHHTPLTTDINVQKNVEKELFLIFEKYESTSGM